jgi:hypothetical protein
MACVWSRTTPILTSAPGVANALALGLILWLAFVRHAVAQPVSQPVPPDVDFRVYAVHISRTPAQPWPGYGMYLGNGLVITAAHVPGNFADTKPRVFVAGEYRPTNLVKQGSLDSVDLTLLSVDASALPVRMRMRRLPLCEGAPFAGESVVVVTPESVARSHVLPGSAVPRDLRARFDTVIGDVATTGNSGSGVIDGRKTCLLGIISRKLTVQRQGARLGAPPQTLDIAKYFVPAKDIRAFIPTAVSF